jgi:hypothetical protein
MMFADFLERGAKMFLIFLTQSIPDLALVSYRYRAQFSQKKTPIQSSELQQL